MNPMTDSLVARACVAADELELEVKRLQKTWQKMDCILRQREPLTEVQRKNLHDLVVVVKLYQRRQEGNWHDGDCRSPAELKLED